MRATVLYRGPLQRSRLSFLFEALRLRYEEIDVVFACPFWPDASRLQTIVDFFRGQSVSSWQILDGRGVRGLIPTSELRRAIKAPEAPLFAVGFTSLFAARAVAEGPLVWCIQGIPEERLLHSNGIRNRIECKGLWRAAAIGRVPDAAIVVSERMARLVKERCRVSTTLVAPTCPRSHLFANAPKKKARHFTYLGTGAPWQGIPRLNGIWQAIHRLDAKATFQVISRDPRCRELGNGLPPASVNFVQSSTPEGVVELLREAAVGFIIRDDSLVNRVSFPTKFGEFVASRTPVVVSDLDWDLSDLVSLSGCGALCAVEASDEAVARKALEVHGKPLDQQCQEAAKRVDRATVSARIAEQLP